MRGDGDESPLVSAVIAAFNSEQFLVDAVESVLGQTWTNVECIVVDDGSTDRTADLVRDLSRRDERVVLVSQTNQGVGRARNAGIARSRGLFVAFLDSDDVWLPNKIERQMNVFTEHPEISFVACGYAITNSTLRERVVVRPDLDDPHLRRWLVGEGSGVGLAFTGVVRTEALRQCGGFDPALSVSADLDLAVRLSLSTPPSILAEPLALYRTHRSQMHLDSDAFEEDMTKVLRRFLSSPEDEAELAAGLANLHTRLLFYRVKSGNWRDARRSLGTAWSYDPARLLALPVRALFRRCRRRLMTLWRRLTGQALNGVVARVPVGPPG